MNRKLTAFLSVVIALCLLLTACSDSQPVTQETTKNTVTTESIPAYSGEPYVAVNGNQPNFTAEEKRTTESFEKYGELDSLGRCTTAYACCGRDIMPTQKRGDISSVKPTGWHSVQYSNVEGKSLYNRCHLIAHELAGEDANKQNLITGTRYMNTEGMLPFENMVADYIKETNNHVLYRVTPSFSGNNLVADGVYMEAYSVEDSGDGICFSIYCYNVQPGITIDYKTGESCLAAETTVSETQSSAKTTADNTSEENYVLNTSSKKFHLPSCPSAEKIKSSNKKVCKASRDELIKEGYSPCSSCKP